MRQLQIPQNSWISPWEFRLAVPALYPKFWGWNFLLPKPEFPKIRLEFPNCWDFSHFFHGSMKQLLNSWILGILDAATALVGKSQLSHSQISRFFIGGFLIFFVVLIFFRNLFQSNLTKPSFGKNPRKPKELELSSAVPLELERGRSKSMDPPPAARQQQMDPLIPRKEGIMDFLRSCWNCTAGIAQLES